MQSSEDSFSTEEVEGRLKELSKRIMFSGLIDQLRERCEKCEEMSPSRKAHVDFLLEIAESFKNREFDEVEDLIKKELIIQFYFSKYGVGSTVQHLMKRLKNYLFSDESDRKVGEKFVPSFSNGLPKLHMFGPGSKPGTSEQFSKQFKQGGGTGEKTASRVIEIESSEEESFQVRESNCFAKRVAKRRAKDSVIKMDTTNLEEKVLVKILGGSDSETEEIHF